MAESKSVLDRYHQSAALTVLTTTAASGLNTNQLVTGLSNQQKVAWAVSEIEYFPSRSALYRIVAASESIDLFLTASASASQEINPTNASLYDVCGWHELVTPVALGGPFLMELPIRHSFAPGNELLVLPYLIFAGVKWNTTAMVAYYSYIRVRYKEIEMGPEDWYDLLQMRMPLGAM